VDRKQRGADLPSTAQGLRADRRLQHGQTSLN